MDGTKPHAFELWMVSNLAAGAATAAFLSLLVPPFVLAETGSAFRAGVVMAIVGLAAVSGPIWGKLADKHEIHRLIYILSVAGMAASFLILAVDAGIDWYSPIFGLILGISLAAQGTIGPAFIVGANLPKKIESRQITVNNLAMPLGQVVGAVALIFGQWQGFGYVGLFWIATIVLAVFALLTLIGITKPSARLKAAQRGDAREHRPPGPEKGRHPGTFRRAMASSFGIMMLVVILSSFSNNGLTSQIANVMPNVYGFTVTQTSALIAVAGLINLVVIVIFGKLMERFGPRLIFTVGTAMRFAGTAMMALVGLLGEGHLILAAIAMQVAFQGSPVSRLPAPLLAIQLSPAGAAEANGYYYASSALGAFLGCLAMGFGADSLNFNTVNWLAAIMAAAALVVLCLALIPSMNRRHKDEKSG